jgi:hypothetical protein
MWLIACFGNLPVHYMFILNYTRFRVLGLYEMIRFDIKSNLYM